MRFSFIVPVYNVSAYFEQCVTSVLEQTVEDYEIILVDDGSTDGSELLCDKYVREYPQKIKCIHQSNKGLSAARNTGIEMAQGDYLIFLDSDDYLSDRRFLELIYPKDFLPDVIVFEWKEVPDGTDKEKVKADHSLSGLNKIYDQGKEYLRAALKENPLYGWQVWKYLYNKKFWSENGFRFKEGITYEDVELTYKVLLSAESIMVKSDIVGYCYRTQRRGSIVYTPNISSYQDMITIAENNIQNVLKRSDIDEALSKALCNNFSCMYYSVVLSMGFINDKKDWKTMVDFLEKYKHICRYAYEKKQRAVRTMIDIWGGDFTSRILGIRTKIKFGRRNKSVP